MYRRIEPEAYHALAAECGIRWIGPVVPLDQYRTTWECPRGHRWTATYADVQQSVIPCPTCRPSKASPKSQPPQAYHDLAAQHHLQWLGPKVQFAEMETEWQCPAGHRCWATYSKIERRGCPACDAERRMAPRRKQPADYHALAARLGFQWLGPKVRRITVKTEWQCPQGHRWRDTYAHLRTAQHCPYCRIAARHDANQNHTPTTK